MKDELGRMKTLDERVFLFMSSIAQSGAACFLCGVDEAQLL